MESHFHLGALLLILFTSPILVSGHLQIPLESGESDKHLDKDIDSLFGRIEGINTILRCYSFITISGTFDLRPSLQQRLMERFSVPIYTVGSQKGPPNHRYPEGENMVITLFSGLDDLTLAVLNDTKLSHGNQFFSFLYISPRNDSRPLAMDQVREFFLWCWERGLSPAFLFFRGELEFETWTYFYFKNVTITRVSAADTFKSVLRRQGFRYLVQASGDPPAIVWYNSTEQADVIGAGNISLAGPVGTLMVEFMRHINSSMDIIGVPEPESYRHEILEVPFNRSADVVANLVENGSLMYSPVVMDWQMCLLVPHRRAVPFSRYFYSTLSPGSQWITLALPVLVFVIKCTAHRRRSLVDSFFNTLRFSLGIPLPAGQLDRLPLADKILEVYGLLFVAIFISTCVSLLSSALTAGIYYPPITDVESMRASGLRIVAADLTVKQAFWENRMPNSLLDLVDIVDEHTAFRLFVELNDSSVYVVRTPNWRGFTLYQSRLKNKRFSFSGPKLCSTARYLRIPVSPQSPLRFIFKEYYERVFESGLQQKWLDMGFKKFREVTGLTKLPRDAGNEFKPLALSFYTIFMSVFIGGMLLSTLVFIIELLYKRYYG